MFKLTLISLILAAFSMSHFAFSAELPKAGKRTNVEYYEIVFVKYKFGMADEAGKHIKKYFVPATEAAGTPEPYVIHMQTGSWDTVLFWTQKNGMGDFDWYISANDEKWWAELAKQNGGIENAEKIFADYLAMVAKTHKDIGHHHMPPMEETKK